MHRFSSFLCLLNVRLHLVIVTQHHVRIFVLRSIFEGIDLLKLQELALVKLALQKYLFLLFDFIFKVSTNFCQNTICLLPRFHSLLNDIHRWQVHKVRLLIQTGCHVICLNLLNFLFKFTGDSFVFERVHLTHFYSIPVSIRMFQHGSFHLVFGFAELTKIHWFVLLSQRISLCLYLIKEGLAHLTLMDKHYFLFGVHLLVDLRITISNCATSALRERSVHLARWLQTWRLLLLHLNALFSGGLVKLHGPPHFMLEAIIWVVRQ